MHAPEAHYEFAAHEELVLRICAAPDADHADRMRQLDAADWNALARMAQHKRAAGLVLRAIGRANAKAMAMVSPSALGDLEAANQWHAFYALKQMAAVKRLIGTLSSGGFAPILLKGFALAHGIYPDRALRPLRDVDLLLSAAEAERAQAFLLASEDYRIADWAGSYGLEYGHQLPEIQDIEHGLTIEIHHRLNARNWQQESLLLEEILREPATLPVLGLDVPVPSARTNFLHLLEHATLHHAFENGPLILADLHFLAPHVASDWPWIEAQCERMGLKRSLHLLLALAHELGATWVPLHCVEDRDVSTSHIDAAKVAMLQDREKAEQNKLLRRLEAGGHGRQRWRAAMIRAFRPNPYQLAKIAGCRADQARRWLFYPVWLFQSGRRFMAASGSEDSLVAAQQEARMVQWLASAESPSS
ncbi:MAG: nucleotidyltransferase family protein [Novosphingobium sp.]